MKYLLILLILPLTSLSQTYIGLKTYDVITNNQDKRYNTNDFRSIGIINDTLSAEFYSSYTRDTANVGTVVFYDSVTAEIEAQSFIYYYKANFTYVSFFRDLVLQGYSVTFRLLEDDKCFLEARR